MVTRNIGVGCSLILGTIQQIIRLHPVHEKQREYVGKKLSNRDEAFILNNNCNLKVSNEPILSVCFMQLTKHVVMQLI